MTGTLDATRAPAQAGASEVGAPDLSEAERGVLRLVAVYGDGLDLGGPRITRRAKAAARSLMAQGFIAGTIRNCRLTDSGRAAITPPDTDTT